MRAWQLTEQSVLKPAEINVPAPSTGEVLVRVHAVGVTPTELIWYPTTHTKTGEKRSNAVPGHEFSGTVEAVGPGVGAFARGQEIYGMNDWFADGATADFCITRTEWIALKPPSLSHAQAASVPIGALTAWQGLFERAHLQAGERVLVHGGSGAVGVFAIQFARLHGAHVITTASGHHSTFLRELGAEQMIDYRTQQFDRLLRDVDVVFDGVGGETLRRSWPILSKKGRLVTIAADSEAAADEQKKAAFFIVEPRAAELEMIGERLENRGIRAFVDTAVPFDDAATAYAGKLPQRRGQGKVVILV